MTAKDLVKNGNISEIKFYYKGFLLHFFLRPDEEWAIKLKESPETILTKYLEPAYSSKKYDKTENFIKKEIDKHEWEKILPGDDVGVEDTSKYQARIRLNWNNKWESELSILKTRGENKGKIKDTFNFENLKTKEDALMAIRKQINILEF